MDIDNDFSMKHTKMLLKYQTYLLYDVKIKLESIGAYYAINWFLENVEGSISHKFFRQVEASVSKDWVFLFNDFMKLYFDKGCKINKISTEIQDEIEEEQTTQTKNWIPTFSFLDYETCPKSYKFPFRIVRTLDTDSDEFTIENLHTINCLYDTILVTPKTLKMLYENRYEFPKKQAAFTQNIWLYIDDAIENEAYKHLIYLAQQFYQFKTVNFAGPKWNFEIVFNGIKSLLLSKFNEKNMFSYNETRVDSLTSGDNSESQSECSDEDIGDYNFTRFQLPKMKLWFYNKQKKKLTMMIAYKITIDIWNDNWHQSGQYLIAKQVSNFKVHQISILEDEGTEEIINLMTRDDLGNESFLALETNLKIHNLPWPKKVVFTNLINQAGYLIQICYFGEEDADIELLINKINDIDEKHFFNLNIMTEMSFTSDKAKELIKLLEKRCIEYFSIEGQYLDKEEAKVILDFLNSPDATYFQISLAFSDTNDVTEALRAIRDRYSFSSAEIATEKPVTKEAEELGMQILSNHFGCSLYINSKVKALRTISEKGVNQCGW